MYRLRVKISRNVDWIDTFFKKVRSTGEWSWARCKIYKGVYNTKSKSLFNMLKMNRKGCEVIKNTSKEYIIDDAVGTKDYVMEQKALLEEWLDSDKEKVKSKAESIDFENDRKLKSIWKKMKWKFQKRKEQWAIDKIKYVISNETVRDFFERAGISFEYEVLKVGKEDS